MLECEPAANADEALLCPLPAGGVVIHNGRTVHGNEPNHSDQDCIVYVRIFATSPIPRAEPREFPWLSALHANRGTEPVSLYPYGLILRHGRPELLGYVILHEGPIGFLAREIADEIPALLPR